MILVKVKLKAHWEAAATAILLFGEKEEQVKSGRNLPSSANDDDEA